MMSITSNRKKILTSFIISAVALVSGWIGVMVDSQLEPQPAGETLGMALWLVMPLITALILMWVAKDDRSDLGLTPKFCPNIRWYGIAIIVFPAVTLFTTFMGKLLGLVDCSTFNGEAYLSGIAVALLPAIIKNFFEEFVWRGYLTSKLVKLNLNDSLIYVIVGGIWGAWHLPYYLHFLPEPVLTEVLPAGRIAFAFIALPTMICWTVMYVELYRITKSIWPLVLLHTVEDATVNHLVIDGHIRILDGTEWIVSPILGVLPTSVYLAIGLALRSIRRKPHRPVGWLNKS